MNRDQAKRLSDAFPDDKDLSVVAQIPMENAKFLRAFGRGERVLWGGCEFEKLCFNGPPHAHTIAPRMSWVEGPGGRYEFPEPVREPLDKGQNYFVCDLTASIGFIVTRWTGDTTDRARLRRKIIHLTKDACLAHTEALTKAQGGEL